MERKTGFEPAAFSLARRCSTTELLPLVKHDYASCREIVQTTKSAKVHERFVINPTS